MIEVENVSKHFGSITAVDDISFSINKGEVVGLLGPNGAGKTTTMRILTCFFPPTRGKAKIAGYDVLESPLDVKRRIGYFPERAPLYPDTPVRSYLHFVAEVKGIGKSMRKEKVAKAMEECGISNVADRIIGNLSKGYRQRVCLAQALLHDPEVLILDEPTIGLDPEQVSEIRKLIKGMGGTRTIVLSTHILSEVSATCNRVIIIDKGKIVAIDSPENLTEKLKKFFEILAQIEGPPEAVIKILREIPGVLSVEKKEELSPSVFSYIIRSKKGENILKEIASIVCGNNWGLLEMKQISMSLEDIFLKLVT